MFLKQMRTKAGRVRLAVYESYWDAEAGKPRHRSIRSLGYVDELEGEHDDPVAWARSVVGEMNEGRRADRQSAPVEIHPMQLVDKRSCNRRNVGVAAALAVYAGLGVERVLRNHARGRSFAYDLNAVCRLLVAERIVEPGSKRAAWERRGRHFFRSDLSLDDVYRGMDELAACRDRVVAAMNRAIAASGGRDAGNVYYDVTNYFFECDPDDEGAGLRARGVSKEHRPNPIVQMGLLQDADGVPISYRLFRGNTQDGQTMIPVLADMKREQGIGRVVAVADKGLNSSDNIAALVGRGDGFVLSQSLRGTRSDAAMKGWATGGGWTTVGEGFKMKSRQGHKTVHLKAADTASGRDEDERVPVKWVAIWSAKYERRARAERAKVIERARDLVAHPGKYTRHTHHGAAQYVRNVQFDEDGGVATNRALSLDEEAIAEAERYDGYYLICTSETSWGDQRILDAYRELWRIEESFKVAKSELEARPAFVWTTPRIEAHFLTCYISLVTLRLLQRATGVPAGRIRSELAAMSCSALDANWWLFDHRTDESDAILDAVGLPELRRKNMRTAEIKAALAKAKRAGIPYKKHSSS